MGKPIKYCFVILVLIFTTDSCDDFRKSSYPEYYRTYNEVLKLQKENKIQEALDLFLKAEKLVEFVPVQHLLTARNLALMLEDCILVQEYFQKAVTNGFEYEEFSYDHDVCPEVDNSSVSSIKIDQEYRSRVITLYQRDQSVRSSGSAKEMKETDSLNINELLTLVEEKGYPSSKRIGSKAAGKAFIILLHFDSDIGNKRLNPIIKKAYLQGMMEPAQYAWIVDRRRNWGPEKLAPHYFQLPTKKYFEMSEQEIAVIDERRDSIGLKPLKEMNITRMDNGGISITY